MEVMMGVRMCLAGVVETGVVLDRVWFLHEYCVVCFGVVVVVVFGVSLVAHCIFFFFY